MKELTFFTSNATKLAHARYLAERHPVRIKGFRSKNGEAYGYSVFVTLADGRTIQTGGAQDAPTTEAPRP